MRYFYLMCEMLEKLKDFVLPRKKVILFAAGFAGLGIIPIMFLGGHELTQVIDSPAFCTQTCHNVHYAEATVFESSPHSEVPCADCHVGAGTDNLVRSKIRGLTDIIPTIIGTYSRPIPTPLEDRRPSKETCEECHWSAKFSGDLPRIETTYNTDESNTKNTTTLVLKLNGGKEEVARGIHWHNTGKVWYLPLDDNRLQIGWVATVNSKNEVSEYIDPNRINKVTPELIQQGKRLMDCVDCHNRVAHLFRPPDELIDAAISDGSIDGKLPFIKREAFNALVPQNASLDQAYAKIENIKDFYRTSYPQIFQEKRTSIDRAITRLNEIARLTTFSNGLDWNTHPDQATHVKPDAYMQVDWESLSQRDNSPGCFRCHGNLVKVDDTGNSLADVLNGLNLSTLKARAANINAGGSNKPILYASSLQDSAGFDVTSFVTGGSNGATNGNSPTEGSLDADCNLCHTSSKSSSTSPLAPATSHPIHGLDNCTTCHSPSAARPFKTTHPWSTNEACNSCHQSAPKLKGLPSTGPLAEAKSITHPIEKLNDCLTCHGPTASQPISKDHPWSTNDTCTACHQLASNPKPLASATPPPQAKAITHILDGLDGCLTCHGYNAPQPISQNHVWSTDDTCSACHQPSPTPKPFPTATPLPQAKAITHSTNGLNQCLSCHGPSSSFRPISSKHPWSTNETCTACHQVSSQILTLPPPTNLTGPDIKHSLAGVNSCVACHSPVGPKPFPSTHYGRTDSFCLVCHKQAAAPIPKVPPPQPEGSGTIDAAALYSTNCASCHGANRQGGAGPALTSTALSNRTLAQVTSMTNHSGRLTSTQITPMAEWLKGTTTVTVPSAPTNLTATATSAGQVNLTWVDNANNETGFRIQRATNSSFISNLVTVTTAPGSTSYSDSTVSGSTTYYYRIYAYNSAGDSTASNTASISTPAATFDAAAIYSANCASCHGANRQGGSGPALTSTALASQTLAQVSSMVNHSGRLTSAQITPMAEWLKGTTTVTVPSAPSSLTASAISAGQINLSWTDNSNNETGFRIQRATNSSFSSNLVTVTTAAGSTSYSDTTVSGSTTYYYRVYAYNSAGDSSASNNVSVTTPAPTVSVPAAPNSLTAIASSATQVNLTWVDNANNETGFRIQRATNSSFSSNLVTVTAAAGSTSYSDTTVSGSTTYYYRVFAYNSAGDSSASNTVSLTTPSATINASALYSANCASCHGANRQGGSGPALTTTALASRTLTWVTSRVNHRRVLTSAQIPVMADYLKNTPP